MSDDQGGSEPKRLYQVVADQMRQAIRSGQFKASPRLPGERELAQMFGVSRPSLREALIALEIEGLVEVRMGSGVYVAATPPRAVAPPGDAPALGDSPGEIMQARLVIEGAVVVMACVRMRPETLAALRGHVDAMESVLENGGIPYDADCHFHVTLAAECGNGVLRDLVGTLIDKRRTTMLNALSRKFESAVTWRRALEEHRAILAALEIGEPWRAEAAMRTHIANAAERWLGT